MAANQRSKHNIVLVTGSPDISVDPNGGGKGGNSVVNGHTYVDLGLPSGTLWATCNVGATKPEEYGDYFAWGETKTKTTYDLNTYKWCNGGYNRLTKYCNASKHGYNRYRDKLVSLTFADDVATANWGSGWRMPKKEEWQELLANCESKWTRKNGVGGRLFTGPNGNSIFLPATGYRWGCVTYDVGIYGYYWSSSLVTNESNRAYGISFYSHVALMDHFRRYYGHTIRPVRSAR